MVALRVPRYTPEQYLTWEREAEAKSEYIDGEIVAMAGASPPHVLITSNIVREIGNAFKKRPCLTYAADLKVLAGFDDLYTYPDVVAVCGEPQYVGTNDDVLTNPNVIVEVLSPSTEAFDRGEKFARYRRISSLTDYIFVAQDKVRIEHYERQANGKWLLTEASDLQDSVMLSSVGCVLNLADVYDKVEFATDANRAETDSVETEPA